MEFDGINRRGLRVDYPTILLYAALVFWGWISIYAAVYNEEHTSIFDISQKYGKQLMFMGGAVVLITGILLTNVRIWTNLAPIWYGVIIVLLIAVLIVGKKVGGARSWFALGSFSLQPSELAKFATALMLGYYLSFQRNNVKYWSKRLQAIAIILLPAVIIALQPDMGSTIVFFSLLLVLYREGVPGYYISIGLGIVVLAISGLIFPLKNTLIAIGIVWGLALLILPKTFKWIGLNSLFAGLSASIVFTVGFVMENVLAAHHSQRIRILLGLEDDPSGAGYNTLQSLIAIGSGGWNGKGFLNGTQTKFNFVPEQSTDYIFCTVGEEWGFLGSALLMLLFGALLARLLFLAERQKNTFYRVYGYSVFSILLIHYIINIGMTIGLMPTIGIPLPFFSYGGSSLWGFTLLLFIFVKMDAERMNTL